MFKIYGNCLQMSYFLDNSKTLPRNILVSLTNKLESTVFALNKKSSSRPHTSHSNKITAAVSGKC